MHPSEGGPTPVVTSHGHGKRQAKDGRPKLAQRQFQRAKVGSHLQLTIHSSCDNHSFPIARRLCVDLFAWQPVVVADVLPVP